MFRLPSRRTITVLSVAAALTLGVSRVVAIVKALRDQGQHALVESLPTSTLRRMAVDAVNAQVTQRVEFETRLDAHADEARRLAREIDKSRRTRDEIAADLKREQEALDACPKASVLTLGGTRFSRDEVAADVNSRQLALARLDEQVQAMAETLAGEQATVQDGRAVTQRSHRRGPPA